MWRSITIGFHSHAVPPGATQAVHGADYRVRAVFSAHTSSVPDGKARVGRAEESFVASPSQGMGECSWVGKWHASSRSTLSVQQV